jgi:hypothetical protein
MYETLGLWRALWLSPRWQIRKCFLVLVTDLQSGIIAPALRAPPVAVDWTVLTERDIRAIRIAYPKLGEDELRRRWREGHECVGGWVGSALAHVRWDTRMRTYLPYLKRVFVPLDGDTFVVEAFTSPTYRGQGLHALSTAFSFERARARGFARSITMVAWWNAAALRVLREKAGRQVAGTVGYWGLGRFTYHFATGAIALGADTVHVRRGVAAGVA